MIVGIRGELVKKEPTRLNIDVHGLIYEVHVSLQCSSAVGKGAVSLHTTQIFREDTQQLFGFKALDEKVMFESLIKISGVGPKAALAICSTFTPEDFAAAIAGNDLTALKKVPGIGPKSAGRILVELDGKLDSVPAPNALSAPRNEASQALQSLGFKKEQIEKVLRNCHANETQTLVKEALKQLAK